ncbi:MAG: type 4a pilus biogenesis protein PilO, partial [Anaerolineae bacterium]|nr:type 4a pilus biogenesis protein PilO [Anaerolineae bacterium]
VQQQLAARGSQEVDPESLKEQIAAAQAALNDAATIFLSDTQAAEVLNRLYQYASDSGVEIISLEAQPGPEERKDTYDVRTFRMEVKGAAPDLIDFVAQIEEAAYDAFIITSVVMAEGEDTHTLTMDIALYTSPYASEQIELPSPSPNATPTTTSSNLAELEEALAAAWASEEWEQAIDLVKEILIIDPSDDDMVDRLYMAYVNYGYHLLEKGDIAGATVQFNNALEITPEGAEALAGLEQVAVMLTPSPTTEELLAQQLDEAWAAENWEEVIGLIEQILAFNPGDEELTEKLYAAHINYGYKLADEGKLEEAKQEFSHALTIKPDGTEAIAGLQELAGGGEVSPTPISTPTPPQSQYTIYVVQRGDNLFRIALRFGTTAEAIKAANGLTSNIIHTGQQLRIPLQ